MDLKNSKVIQSILENASDGVCTIHADFTPVKLPKKNPIFSTFQSLFSSVVVISSITMIVDAQYDFSNALMAN